MDAIINVSAFAIFAVLWIGFAVALVASQGSLDAVWEWLRGLPLVAQGIVWLLLLPVTAGLWAWESGWPFVVRLVVVGGLASVSLYLFFPRALLSSQP
jgi:hypothetical protein